MFDGVEGAVYGGMDGVVEGVDGIAAGDEAAGARPGGAEGARVGAGVEAAGTAPNVGLAVGPVPVGTLLNGAGAVEGAEGWDH